MDAFKLDDAISHKWHEGSGYRTLKLWGILETYHIATVEGDFKELQAKAPGHLLINFENVSQINPDWLRCLMGLQTQLKKTNHSLIMIKVNPTVMTFFKQKGVDSALKISVDIRTALSSLGLTSPKRLDTDFVNPFLEAVINILTSYGVAPKAAKPYLKKAGEKYTGDVSGVIGITSESFSGSVVLSFPEATFLKIMGSMLQETYTELNDEILDGAGEITNQVFGRAKTTLNEKGYGIKTAIPSVISGKNHSLTSLTKGPTVVVPFSSSAGDFYIEICVSE